MQGNEKILAPLIEGFNMLRSRILRIRVSFVPTIGA